MAAVDVDVREVTKAAKARGAASGGSLWKRGDGGGGVHVHEQVVCSIKAHQNGTLEIAPGRYSPCLCFVGRRVVLVSPTSVNFLSNYLSFEVSRTLFRLLSRTSSLLTAPLDALTARYV